MRCFFATFNKACVVKATVSGTTVKQVVSNFFFSKRIIFTERRQKLKKKNPL